MMRKAFSDALVRIAQFNPNVLLLTGDHGYALFDDFRRHCPDQYINAGIAEQNMIGMAAGLARTGFRPFVYGLSAFIPTRVVEQIKLDVAHDNLPVVFIGDGAGFVYSHLGTSHQSFEDIACLRAIPNIQIYSPSDQFETTQCMNWAYETQATCYLRLGKSDRGDVHIAPISSQSGDLLPVKINDRADFAFIATGSLVLTAKNIAQKYFPLASVWSVPTLKPIDVEQVVSICKNHHVIVVLEEHSVYGGLGGIISEIASERMPTKILRIGVRDRLSEKCGSYEYLLREHGLDENSILDEVRRYLSTNHKP